MICPTDKNVLCSTDEVSNRSLHFCHHISFCHTQVSFTNQITKQDPICYPNQLNSTQHAFSLLKPDPLCIVWNTNTYEYEYTFEYKFTLKSKYKYTQNLSSLSLETWSALNIGAATRLHSVYIFLLCQKTNMKLCNRLNLFCQTNKYDFCPRHKLLHFASETRVHVPSYILLICFYIFLKPTLTLTLTHVFLHLPHVTFYLNSFLAPPLPQQNYICNFQAIKL